MPWLPSLPSPADSLIVTAKPGDVPAINAQKPAWMALTALMYEYVPRKMPRPPATPCRQYDNCGVLLVDEVLLGVQDQAGVAAPPLRHQYYNYLPIFHPCLLAGPYCLLPHQDGCDSCGDRSFNFCEPGSVSIAWVCRALVAVFKEIYFCSLWHVVTAASQAIVKKLLPAECSFYQEIVNSS